MSVHPTAVQYERPLKRPCCRRTYELDSKRQREDEYSSWEDQLYELDSKRQREDDYSNQLGRPTVRR